MSADSGFRQMAEEIMKTHGLNFALACNLCKEPELSEARRALSDAIETTLSAQAARLAAAEARIATMREALELARSGLAVNDDELTRIRNRCELADGGDVKIWSGMLQRIVDHVRDLRRAAAAIRTEDSAAGGTGDT